MSGIASGHPGDFQLSGRSLVVTGAASGIGRATAIQASLAGMHVIGIDRDAARLDETRSLLEAGDGERLADAIVADLQDPSSVESVSERLAAARPDHLFHAAGIIIRRDSISEVTTEEWDTQVAINQRASWFLTRGFCGQLQDRGALGSAVLVSSISGSLGLMSGSWVYATTKAGVNAMVKGFAKTYSPQGIRINAIAPGLVETPMVVGDVRTTEIQGMVDAHVPMGRLAKPEEISRAAMFLLSDHASYITGVTLDVDGGWLRR